MWDVRASGRPTSTFIPLPIIKEGTYSARSEMRPTGRIVVKRATKSLELGWGGYSPPTIGGVAARRHGRKPKAHTRHLAI